MDKLLTITILQLSIFSTFLSAQRFNHIGPEKVECFANPEFVQNIKCELKLLDDEKFSGSAELDLVKTLNNITAKLTLYRFHNGFKPLLSKTLNICDFISGKTFNPLRNIALKIAKEYSNVNHTCPYEGHITAKGIYTPGVTMKFIPSTFVIPSGKYKLVAEVYEGYPFQYLGKIEITGELAERINKMDKKKSQGF